MSSLGAALRSERIRQGLTLEQISDEIKVSPRQLGFIEAEQYDKLPGAVFARNFTRQYANRLGLSDSLIAPDLQEIDDLFGGPPVPLAGAAAHMDMGRLTPDPETSRSLAALAGWVATAALLCGSGYWIYTRLQPKPAPAAGKVRPSPAAPTATPAASPVTTANPASAASGLQIELAATEPCWTRLTADGKTLLSGLLQPGEKKSFGPAKSASLLAGNAGGLRVTVNGKDLGPVGARGQRLTVLISQDGLRAVPKAPPPTTPS